MSEEAAAALRASASADCAGHRPALSPGNGGSRSSAGGREKAGAGSATGGGAGDAKLKGANSVAPADASVKADSRHRSGSVKGWPSRFARAASQVGKRSP